MDETFFFTFDVSEIEGRLKNHCWPYDSCGELVTAYTLVNLALIPVCKTG